MPPRKPAHVFDLVAQDVAEAIERAAKDLADMVQDQGSAPFAVPLTRPEQEAYYVAKYKEYVYNPDGSPNEPGREELLKAFGAEAFAEIVRVVLRARRNEPAPPGPPLSFPVFAPEQPPGPAQLAPGPNPPPGAPPQLGPLPG